MFLLTLKPLTEFQRLFIVKGVEVNSYIPPIEGVISENLV